MKISIVSDSHDNMPNIDKFLDFARREKIESMIHCGDICKPDVLKHFADNFVGEIYAVHGNIDYDYFADGGKKAPQPFGTMEPTEKDGNDEKDDTKKLHFFGAVGKIDIAGKKVGFCHLPETARELAESGEYDYVFYGHTHMPAQKMVGKCMLLNPGTLAGTFSRAAFAVWDTERNVFELKLLEKL